MKTGLYIALSGATAQERSLDVISNNLANVNTRSFKRDSVVFESFLGESAKEEGVNIPLTPGVNKFAYVIAGQEARDYSQGSLIKTGRDMDVAIDGKGFYAVETPEGRMYTRNGDFRIGKDGTLLTTDGYPVLGIDGKGENGYAPIRVLEASRLFSRNTDAPFPVTNGIISISQKGEVAVLKKVKEGIAGKSIRMGRIALVDFEGAYSLSKVKGGLYRLNDPDAKVVASNAALRQGFFEQSNVNSMQEMTRLIAASRGFESYQKVIQSLGGMTGTLIEEVGGNL